MDGSRSINGIGLIVTATRLRSACFFLNVRRQQLRLRQRAMVQKQPSNPNFKVVGNLNFADGFVARMGKKRIEGNLNAAKRLLEAS